MRNKGNVIQRNKRQSTVKSQKVKRWPGLANVTGFLAIVICLVVMAFGIRFIYSQLRYMQEGEKAPNIMGFDVIAAVEDAITGEDENDKKTDTDQQEKGYVDSIDTWVVGKPVERTEQEVLYRLSELAEYSDTIKEIYQNHSQYPQQLLEALANNPEMADFAAMYTTKSQITTGFGAITEAEQKQEFPLFLQWDPRWGYAAYGESCVGLAGCGPTCLSMVMFYLTGDTSFTPDRIAEYSMKNGYYVKGSGTAWALMQDFPSMYGVTATEISASEQNMKAVLDSGKVIVCAMRGGDFTTSGHYIVIYGYDAAGFMINDPNCVARSNKRWSFREIQYQLKNIWAYSR